MKIIRIFAAVAIAAVVACGTDPTGSVKKQFDEVTLTEGGYTVTRVEITISPVYHATARRISNGDGSVIDMNARGLSGEERTVLRSAVMAFGSFEDSYEAPNLPTDVPAWIFAVRNDSQVGSVSVTPPDYGAVPAELLRLHTLFDELVAELLSDYPFE